MTRPRDDQITELFARIRSWADSHPDVIMRMALHREHRIGTTIPDGYPTSTMSDGGRSGAHIVADGERVPVTATELAVFNRADWHGDDDHRRHTKAMLDCLMSIIDRINSFAAHARAIEAATRQLPKDDDDVWCKHHASLGINEPVGTSGRRGLCGWCEGFEREHRCLPPKVLVDRKARGERINDTQIAAALGKVA